MKKVRAGPDTHTPAPVLCHPAGPQPVRTDMMSAISLLIAVVQAPGHSITIVSSVCARRAETGLSQQHGLDMGW